MKLARHIRLNRYFLSLTSLLVVFRRGGRGSDPVKKVNIILNKQTKQLISTYFMLKHVQRSTTKQSVYLRTSTVDTHAFTPARLRKL